MRHIWTMAEAYQAICQGLRPWTALGDFMNEWFGYATDQREALVADPIIMPPEPTEEQYRWAVFCIASVEYLCDRYHVLCPTWIQSADVHLTIPWFHRFHPDQPDVQLRLRATTPEPFARRNIFCGDRVFANKYEWAEEMLARKWGRE
jgi:hypothetical protein